MHTASVIIICRNEIGHIERCIDAVLAQQSEVLDVEVIFVDGNSTDGSRDLVKSKYTGLVKIISNPEQFTPVAINKGITAASGEYICFTGARSILSAGYLQACIDKLAQHPAIGCVGGAIRHEGESNLSKNIATAMSVVIGVGMFNFRTIKQSGYVDTVSSPVFRKKLADEIGLLDESFIRNQDDDFSYRIRKAGYKIWLNTDVFTTYYVRSNLHNLSRQYYQYGFWKILVNRKHKTIITARQVFPALLVLSMLASVILLFTSCPVAGLIIPAGYFFVLLISSVILAIARARSVVLLFVSFVTLHFSYGVGYLHGLINTFVLLRQPPSTVKQLSR